ncbi:MAG TPA: chromate transporter [Bacilli bacterium]
MLWDLFLTFFLIGFVSFGGGFAMIPLIQEEVVNRHNWMTPQEFTDVIAVAGMSPGPIATNISIFIGFEQMGFIGAVISCLGVVTPSFIIILVIGAAFNKLHNGHAVKSAFYGLRPIITGLIIYTAIMFAVNNGLFASFSWHTLSLLLIFAGSLAALLYYRIHPVYVIMFSGLFGVAIYG